MCLPLNAQDSRLAAKPVSANLADGANAGFVGRGSPPNDQPPQKAFDITQKAKHVCEYCEGQIQLQGFYDPAIFAALDTYEKTADGPK